MGVDSTTNFRVEFDVGVNDYSISSGNEQQVVLLGHSSTSLLSTWC